MFPTLIVAVFIALSACHGSGAAEPEGTSGDAPAGDAAADDAAFVPASHRAWPQVPPRQGIVLSGMRLVWITSPGDDAGRAYYGPLFEALATSNPWWDAVAGEYGIQPPHTVISLQGATTLAGTTPFSLAELKTYVDDAIAAQPALAPDGNTLYVLLLPKGVGTGSPCSAGGSHTLYGSHGDGWAHITRCSTTTGTYTTSHEIIEAATDPTYMGYQLPFDRSTAWAYSPFAATDGEVGDLCEGMGSFVDGGVKYQRSWSNHAAATDGAPCVPAATTPFFDVSAPQDWYPITPGGSIDVPLTGFSTAPLGDWALSARIVSRPDPGSGDGYSATLAGSAIHNGGTTTLTVHAASTVTPGSWALVRVISDGTPAGIAESYAWPIGIYVASSH